MDPVDAVSVGLVRHRAAPRALAEGAKELADERTRFINLVFDDLDDLVERWPKLRERIDAVVFPGIWLHDQVRRATPLGVPATHLPVTAEVLYATILRATRRGADLRHLSVDSMPKAAVSEALGELGLPEPPVLDVMDYGESPTWSGYQEFHVARAAAGATLAITTATEVVRALETRGITVAHMLSTRSTVRETLQRAVLLARGTRLHDQQIAMVAVRLPSSGTSTPDGPSNYSQQELSLTVHRHLLAQCRPTGAVVTSRSEALFMITATRGGLDDLTNRLRTAPFVRSCRDELGIDLWVGVGLGESAQLAERHALLGVDQAATDSPGTCVLVDVRASRRRLDPTQAAPPKSSADERHRALLRQLINGLDGGQAAGAAGRGSLTVGVEEVAAILGMTDRTSRRVCKALIESGLAWPSPAIRSPHGGRPRQQIQLLAEKLD